MPPIRYSRITSILGFSSPATPDNPDSTTAKPTALGNPQRKPYFDNLDLLAVLTSLACLAASICAITPKLSFAWHLGYQRQITVIGLLLSVMNICLRRVATTFFLILEVRLGTSSLQNYDAILRNSIFVSHTSLYWRGILFLFLILPLGLSAAYKQFHGGESSTVIIPSSPGYYGMKAPPLGTYNAWNNSVYLIIAATAEFVGNASDDSVPPPFASLPVAYGFNNLLLDNTSAAMLDMPVPDYILSIQQELTDTNTESWQISASVNATVARYNISDVYKTNMTLWEDAFDHYDSFRTFWTFDNHQFGILFGKSTELDGTTCFLGGYPSNSGILDSYYGATHPESLAFRSAGRMFNIRRERCKGTWEITKTEVRLIDGSCTNVQTNQSVFNGGNQPYSLDSLPVIVHPLTPFTDGRHNSQWLLPSYVTYVAAIYWARMAWITTSNQNDPEIYYQAIDEYIVSGNETLRAEWLLYIVLAVQPFLITALFFTATIFYLTPIGHGFGLVAILSGIERHSLDILRGAALSGKLQKPVVVNITVTEDPTKLEIDPDSRQIQYTLAHEKQKTARLEKDKKYS